MTTSAYVKTTVTDGRQVTRTVIVEAGNGRVLVVTRDGNHAPVTVRRSGPPDQIAEEVAREIGRDLLDDGYFPDRRTPLIDTGGAGR
jgi:hypothetical protein